MIARDKLEWEHERRVSNDEAHREVERVLLALGYAYAHAMPEPEATFKRVEEALEAETVAILSARGIVRSGVMDSWGAREASRIWLCGKGAAPDPPDPCIIVTGN
jgi:hypothetical protein